MSTGRPSLRPIPHILIVPSCGEFYKAVLLFRARNAQPIHNLVSDRVTFDQLGAVASRNSALQSAKRSSRGVVQQH